MSNFSFSHIVFKRFTLWTHKNQSLFGKGLTQALYYVSHPEDVQILTANTYIWLIVVKTRGPSRTRTRFAVIIIPVVVIPTVKTLLLFRHTPTPLTPPIVTITCRGCCRYWGWRGRKGWFWGFNQLKRIMINPLPNNNLWTCLYSKHFQTTNWMLLKL